MAKIIKIIGRIVGISFEWILIFILLFAFAIRTSPVQTYLASFATDILSKELKTEFKIGKVSIVSFDKLALEDVLIKDQKQETLASIPRVYVTLKSLNLRANKIVLNKIELDKGLINLNRDKTTGDYNYWFITDYFAGGESSGGKAIDLYLNEIRLNDIKFNYDDNRKYYSKFGVDYDHIHLKHVNIIAKDISVINETIKASIKEISAIDKSGFILKKFKTNCEISPKGVLMKNLSIKTPYSSLYAKKMNLLMDRYECFYSFEDSVSFDSKINPSAISMKDIAFFATALEGMEQKVFLTADVTRKVKDLKISNLKFKTGDNIQLIGTLNLPDFRNFEKAFFQEKIDFLNLPLADLKKIKMPKDNGGGYLSFDKYVERLEYFNAKNLKLDGFYSQFVIAANQLNTSLGSIKFDNGIIFTENKQNNSYFFERSEASEYDVKIEKFQLDKFLNDSNFGEVDGTVFLSGEAFSINNIKFNDIEGNINHFHYLDYTYENLFVENGKFVDNIFDAKIEVKDDNLNLVYDGFIDFNGNQHMNFNIDLTKAILDNLNITHIDNTKLSSNFTIDLTGSTSNSLFGTIKMNGLVYTEGDKKINIPALTIKVDRSIEEDILTINSSVLNTTIIGKVDFGTVVNDFKNQFSKIFPAIVKPQLAVNSKKGKKKKAIIKPKNHFQYSIEIKEAKDFLSIFVPDLMISSGTKISGNYIGETEDFSMKIISPFINYQNIKMQTIAVEQKVTSTELTANYTIKKFHLNDSINVDNLIFKTSGTKDTLTSQLTWNPETKNDSKISWNTVVLDYDKYKILLDPSYFALREKRWDIKNQSFIGIDGLNIEVVNFLLARNDQYIAINGKISTNDEEKLNFKINDLLLDEFAYLIGSPINISGLVNGWGHISNPYNNLNYIGDANIQNLFIDNREVGNVFVQSQWNKNSNSFGLTGDLIYKNIETFAFEGNYSVDKKDNNLDFNLLFDHTDIQFTNAFMDPDVMSNIKGLINGSLKVTGNIEEPVIEGEVELINGNTKLDILGVNFGLNGKISSDKYGFYINNMPVNDEEGNTGSLNGSIYHSNFKDWNFDLLFNLEDDYIHKDPLLVWKPAPLNKFLVLNTQFKEGDIYYGKGYGTGTANIYGFADNIEITVNLKTEKDTKIIFPMYEVAQVEDEESFIKYTAKNDTLKTIVPQIDFTGVDLDLNFEITPEANLKVIFNDKTGDQITAKGAGNIAVKLDNLGDVEMEGTFNVKNGMYNFVMGSVRQPLFIQQGSITWTGDPYNAYIDLKTYFDVKASISEISPDNITGTANSTPQDIQCFINLSESLFKPAIAFDIKAPKATDEGQSLINRVVSDPDEKNRQFFSLLLWKHFQPLQGAAGTGGGSAALDLVANQINSMLSQVSKDYKLKLDLGADANGGNTVALDVSKQFLDNRLILTGSFGVDNSANSSNSTSSSSTTTKTSTSSQSSLIGDVNLEYLLNESGTFRINVFNESNDNTIIQQKSLGLFTQGAGLHYQEDFNDINSFKMIQYALDVFRVKTKKKFINKKKRKLTTVPSDQKK